MDLPNTLSSPDTENLKKISKSEPALVCPGPFPGPPYPRAPPLSRGCVGLSRALDQVTHILLALQNSNHSFLSTLLKPFIVLKTSIASPLSPLPSLGKSCQPSLSRRSSWVSPVLSEMLLMSLFCTSLSPSTHGDQAAQHAQVWAEQTFYKAGQDLA